MKKRSIIAVASLLTFVLVFSGCSSAPSKNETKESTSSSSAINQTEDALEGEIVINVAANLNLGGWEAVAKKYMELHKKVNVVVDLKPQEEYKTWLETQLNSNDTKADLVKYEDTQNDVKILNLLPYAKKVSPYSNKPWKEQFNFATQDVDLAKGEWKKFSPELVQVLWFYNKDLFRKAGLDPEKTPTTWDEMIKICETLYNKGIQPIGNSGDYNSMTTGSGQWLFRIYLDQYLRDYVDISKSLPEDWCYDPEVDGVWKYDPMDPNNDDKINMNVNSVRFNKALKDGKIRVDAPEYKAVLENLKKVFPKYAGEDAWYGFVDPRDALYRQDAAMILDGSWTFGLIEQYEKDFEKSKKEAEEKGKEFPYSKFEWGVFKNPSMEGELVDAPARSINVATNPVAIVSKDSLHNDLVVDFLMFYSSKDGMSIYLKGNVDAGGSLLGPNIVYDVEYPGNLKDTFGKVDSKVGNIEGKITSSFAAAASSLAASTRQWYIYTTGYFKGKVSIDEWGQKNQQNVEKYFDNILKATKMKPEDLEHPEVKPNVD